MICIKNLLILYKFAIQKRPASEGGPYKNLREAEEGFLASRTPLGMTARRLAAIVTRAQAPA
jgi:hypothetical protein